jgi:hypothetical protein
VPLFLRISSHLPYGSRSEYATVGDGRSRAGETVRSDARGRLINANRKFVDY